MLKSPPPLLFLTRRMQTEVCLLFVVRERERDCELSICFLVWFIERWLARHLSLLFCYH